MNFESQLLFFFSALGAFNGLLLSIYFAITARKKAFSNYYLSLLLLVVSIRIIKSVFMYFNPQLANVFIQIGLSACVLIGPFLYLYLKKQTEKSKEHWVVHVIPYLLVVSILGFTIPYVEYKSLWNPYVVRGIYVLWFIYLVASFKFVRPFMVKLKNRNHLKNVEVWYVSIYSGVSVIWIAYNTTMFTSYIVGALSFSFVLYLMVLLFVFRNKSTSTFFQEKQKYENKTIPDDVETDIELGLHAFAKAEHFTDPKLTLDTAAEIMNVSKHQLSQYLNERLGKSFKTYINGLRVEKAKELLLKDTPFTIEAIGYESGFSSKSAFYNAFKKETGMTPTAFKKPVS